MASKRQLSRHQRQDTHRFGAERTAWFSASGSVSSTIDNMNRTDRHTVLTGLTFGRVDVRLGPERFFHFRDDTPLVVQHSRGRANPPAGAAFNAPFPADRVPLFFFSGNGTDRTNLHAGGAAGTGIRYRKAHRSPEWTSLALIFAGIADMTCSASAKMVSAGLTPRFAGMIDPSAM